MNVIRPQEGYQMNALASSADIVIGGGAAGAGKTFCLLLESVRHTDNPDFGTVIFRRTYKQIHAQGGLWDASMRLFSMFKGARSRESESLWIFPSGAKLKFNHLEYEKNVYDWQGAEIPLIGFDELTHFSKSMFFYMLSRNRSTCGVKPYVRATCNPDPDSWVADFIAWWIDQDTGYPIPERDGVIRYFIRDNDEYIWGDTAEECAEKAGYLFSDKLDKMSGSGVSILDMVKSVTFISGDIYNNKELLKVNPQYLGNLMSQDADTRRSLLEGNWKTRVDENDLYDYSVFLDAFTNSQIKPTGQRRITADIAMKGSDKFIVIVWDGSVMIDISVIDKSNGKDVIDTINHYKQRYRVQNSGITFDNDGVGSFIDGFIVGAKEFNNGSKTLNGENYQNLKTQCYYKSADRFDSGKVYIPEHVAEKMYDDKMTIRQRLLFERKAIKRLKADHDGKLRIIPKDEMKKLLQGSSPDLLDAVMMFEIFELRPRPKAPKGRVYA